METYRETESLWGQEQLKSLQDFMGLALHRNVTSAGLAFLEVTNRTGGIVLGEEVQESVSKFISEAKKRGFQECLPAPGTPLKSDTLERCHVRLRLVLE